MNKEKSHFLNELPNLFQFLLPELSTFKNLVKEMAQINSPCQDRFNYIKILVNTENQPNIQSDIQKTIPLIVQELNEFSLILDILSKNSEVSQLYLEKGLLDKCLKLQQKMAKKLDIQAHS